ncbi:hypothetical protein SNEBB_005162 [Seison nebaliae]|nr:hypothetical protein SNEBB_005162 [Seison nebaliae]
MQFHCYTPLNVERCRSSYEKLGDITKLMSINQERILLAEGELYKLCRKGPHLYRCFLYDDYFVYVKKMNNLMNASAKAFSMKSVTIQNASEFPEQCLNKQLNYSIELLTPKKSFQLFSQDEHEMLLWKLFIISAINIHLNPGCPATSTSLVTSLSHGLPSHLTAAPIWQVDSEEKRCKLCQANFNLINRRHHCRSCGYVVCDNCSKGRSVIAGQSSTEKDDLRVCDACKRKLDYVN